jgi:phosphohistidine phosphatase
MSDRRDSVQLHLLRHAHAGDPNGWQGPDDVRPLSAKGEEQAERLGRFLAGIGFQPDAIVSSPKTRAARTAEIVADALGMKIRLDDRLGGALDLVAIEAILFDLDEPVRPVLVGHDPDFSDLAASLTGSRTMAMRKGALARIDAPRPLAAGSGVIRWLVPPDLLAGPKAR